MSMPGTLTSVRLRVLLPLAVGIAVLLAACTREDPPRLPGTLERDRIEIAAEASEPITAIEVREGERVEAGRVLLRQETQLAEARAAQAEALAAQARNRLAELVQGARIETIDEARARVAALEATLARDEREFLRVDGLVEQRLLSESELDRARAARDASRANLRAAQAQLAMLMRGTRIEELDQARAALAAAEARLKEITLSNERLIVRAPQAAIVDALPYEVGERPPQGGTIAVLLADTAPYARVYIPEPLRVRVRPGSRALVYVDGREDPLPGTMRFVSSEAAFTPYYALTQRDRSRLSFLAEVEVTDPRARDLPVGVPVEVELIEVGRE